MVSICSQGEQKFVLARSKRMEASMNSHLIILRTCIGSFKKGKFKELDIF